MFGVKRPELGHVTVLRNEKVQWVVNLGTGSIGQLCRLDTTNEISFILLYWGGLIQGLCMLHEPPTMELYP